MKDARDLMQNNFETIAREWFKKQKEVWVEAHASRVIRRLELNVFAMIGKRPIKLITPPELLEVLKKIEQRGAFHTAHRVKQICGQVFRYAIATGRAERDPSADLKGALTPTKTKNMAAITHPQKIGGLLRAIDAYDGQIVTVCALKLAPLVFVRPGELRHAEWLEVDLGNATWKIPAEKMKMKVPHIVPLHVPCGVSTSAAILEIPATTNIGVDRLSVFPVVEKNFVHYVVCCRNPLKT